MIKYLELKRVTAQHGSEISEAVQRVVDSGWYLQGAENKAFCEEFASFIGTTHCVGSCAMFFDSAYKTAYAE